MLAGSIPGIPKLISPTILLLYARYWTWLTSICSHLTQFPCSSPGFVQFEAFLSINIVLIEFDVPPAYKPLIVLSSAHNSVLNNCFRSFREFFFSAQNGYCMQRWSNWLVLFISTLSLIIVFVLFIFSFCAETGTIACNVFSFDGSKWCGSIYSLTHFQRSCACLA